MVTWKQITGYTIQKLNTGFSLSARNRPKNRPPTLERKWEK